MKPGLRLLSFISGALAAAIISAHADVPQREATGLRVKWLIDFANQDVKIQQAALGNAVARDALEDFANRQLTDGTGPLPRDGSFDTPLFKDVLGNILKQSAADLKVEHIRASIRVVQSGLYGDSFQSATLVDEQYPGAQCHAALQGSKLVLTGSCGASGASRAVCVEHSDCSPAIQLEFDTKDPALDQGVFRHYTLTFGRMEGKLYLLHEGYKVILDRDDKFSEETRNIFDASRGPGRDKPITH